MIAWLVTVMLLLPAVAMAISRLRLNSRSITIGAALILFLASAAAAVSYCRCTEKGERRKRMLLCGLVPSALLGATGFIIRSETMSSIDLIRILAACMSGAMLGAVLGKTNGGRRLNNRFAARKNRMT